MSGIILPGDEGKPEEKKEATEDLSKRRPERMIGPQNNEGLFAAEVVGRCNICTTVGTIVYPKGVVPPKDTDRILAYRPVKCFCFTCRKTTEFVPIEVKKYDDVPFLKNVQDGFKKGDIQ